MLDDIIEQPVAETVEQTAVNSFTSLSNSNDISSQDSLHLLESYKESKQANPRNINNVQIARALKYKLGTNFDYMEQTLDDSDPIYTSLCSILVNWYKERFEWPNKLNRPYALKYNLAKFSESLDAIILAYSDEIADCKHQHDVNKSIENFTCVMNKWLFDEGEDHQRGQPDPYMKERYGLVSKHIVTYMVTSNSSSYPDAMQTLPERAKLLAISLERKIKPMIYHDVSQDDPLFMQYVNSIENRAKLYHFDVPSDLDDNIFHKYVLME